MSIVLGSVDTGAALHGSINPTPWEYARTVQTFFGVVGEYHLHGRARGRDLAAWVMPTGYASHANLQTDIDALNSLVGAFGSMTWTAGADSKTFTNCIFQGFSVDEDPWYDGSGVNGWQVRGTIRFRQIAQ